MNIKNKNRLNKPWNNMGILFAVIVIFTVFTMSAPNLNNAGIGGIANLLLPTVIGITTILIYLISRIFIRTWNWVITICGIIYMGYISVMLFFDKL